MRSRCGGKPRIAVTRMPVATIAQLHLEMIETLEEIAFEYSYLQHHFMELWCTIISINKNLTDIRQNLEPGLEKWGKMLFLILCKKD